MHRKIKVPLQVKCNTYPQWRLESEWGSVQGQQWLGKSCQQDTGNLDSLCKQLHDQQIVNALYFPFSNISISNFT